MKAHFNAAALRTGFPGGSDGEESTCDAGDPGSIPGLGRFPGEGNGNPLQDSCLENSMDGEAWWATVHGVPKSRTISIQLLKVFTQGTISISFFIQGLTLSLTPSPPKAR